ncbi:MAG: Beta-barrel assembly-enhancing protease [Thermoanaerobaculia bacterium]|nr:Beta-barrel assembly-enhancing protease [Thermoanaerobaculia bacterium]
MKKLILQMVIGAVVSSAFLISCVTNPVTGKSEFSLISEEEEKSLGAQSYGPMIQQSNGTVTDPPLQAFVQRVGGDLSKASHRPALDYQFTVVNANYFNAFALPGGKVCITRGLLAQMTTEDQMAGVLGHEIGHVTARHGAASVTRGILAQTVLTAGAVAMEAGETKNRNLYLAAAGIGGQLILMRYSRDQERQSDELGMAYMAKAGYNPKGFVESMEILKTAHDKEPSKLEALFQSHPITSERIDTGRQRAANLYPSESARPIRTKEFEGSLKNLKAEIPAFKVADEGEKALTNKDYRTAVSKFMEASRMAPRQAILPAKEAVARLLAEDFQMARTAAAQAIEKDRGLHLGLLVSGIASAKLGSWRDAARDLELAEKAGGPSVASSFFLGRAYEESGSRDRAAERYKWVVENGPDGQETRYARQRLVEWGALASPAPAPQR